MPPRGLLDASMAPRLTCKMESRQVICYLLRESGHHIQPTVKC